MEAKLRVFVVGATGAVGKAIVQELVKNLQFDKITLIVRRQLDLPTTDEDANYERVKQEIVDFEKLCEYKDCFKDHEVGFSALGTTRGKSGAAGFYRVDHDYNVEVAKLAKETGCKHFHLVSSLGADKTSFFLYQKTKGETEEDIIALQFERLSIYRPGVFIVNRAESRLAESILGSVLKPFDSSRKRCIEVPILGKVIVDNCFRPAPTTNVEILNNSDIININKGN